MRKLMDTKGPDKGMVRKPSEAGMDSLVMEMLGMVTKVHIAHLKTTSYAKHMALGAFYEELPGIADSIAEQYQGVSGKLLECAPMTIMPFESDEAVVEGLIDLYAKISAYQESCMHTEIQNELDLVKSLIDKTLYKLNFLG